MHLTYLRSWLNPYPRLCVKTVHQNSPSMEYPFLLGDPVKKSRQNGMETFSSCMKASSVIHPLKSVFNSSQGVALVFHTSCYFESYGKYFKQLTWPFSIHWWREVRLALIKLKFDCNSTDSIGLRREYVPIPILPSHSASPRTLTYHFTFASFNICLVPMYLYWIGRITIKLQLNLSLV